MGNKKFDPRAYWESRLSRSHGFSGVGYQGLGHCFNAWMYRVRANIFSRVIHLYEIKSRANQVLDIGSGTGFYVDLWKKAGAGKITACDFSGTSVNILKSTFPDITVLHVDISEPNQWRAQYDAVSCFDVLFHIVDEKKFQAALMNINQLLKKGGYLLFSDNFIQKNAGRQSTHHINRSLSYYKEQLFRSGFEILKRAPMFYLMNEPVDSRSRMHKTFWRCLTKLAGKSEKAACLLGMILYPFEILLLRMFSEGPSTEIMICRKVSENDASFNDT